MRFSTLILSAFLAALSVKAQNNATATATSAAVVSGTAPLTPAQSSEAACLKACPSDDNTCRTKCVPLGSSTNAIGDCIAACPKGNGTAADNNAYLNCVFNCQNAVPASATAAATTAGTAAGTGASGAATAAATGTTTAGGAAASGTGTATGASASATKASGAEKLQLGASLVGAVGLFAALFAL